MMKTRIRRAISLFELALLLLVVSLLLGILAWYLLQRSPERKGLQGRPARSMYVLIQHATPATVSRASKG